MMPAVSAEELRVSRAVRSALSRISGPVIEEFVRTNPRCTVFDFCQAHLAGLYPKASGGTKLAYLAIQNRLYRARRKLGLPPLTGERRARSIDRPGR